MGEYYEATGGECSHREEVFALWENHMCCPKLYASYAVMLRLMKNAMVALTTLMMIIQFKTPVL